MMQRIALVAAAVAVMSAGGTARAAFTVYGDQDVLGFGSYGSDPTAGATLQGLAPNAVTFSSLVTGHGFPFDPEAGEFLGTDQIYAGSNQTAFGDGYSQYGGRVAGPQVITLDYSSLVPAGEVVLTLTLGIAADDFQFPVFGQPFTASIDGVTNTALTNTLNGLSQTGPVVQFFTIGLTPVPGGPYQLTLAIDQLGDGRDGWAIDFLTVGVTTGVAAVPEPASVGLLAAGAVGLAAVRRRRRAG